MADNANEAEELEQQAPEPEETGKGPNAAIAAEKYRAQRDEYKGQLEAKQRELDDLSQRVKALEGDSEKVKELQAQLEAKDRESAEAAKKAEWDRVNTARLMKEGCVDVDVALGLLDDNGDVEALKKEKPYLFAKTGSTGLRPGGDNDDHEERRKAARRAAGLPL